MIERSFTTAHLPARDRFGRVREVMSQQPVPYDVSSAHAVEFTIDLRRLRLGPVLVWTAAVQPLTLRRTPELIREYDPESYSIFLLHDGTVSRLASGQETRYGPGDVHVNDSSRPYELRMHGATEPVSAAGAVIPKRLLPLPRDRTDQLVGQRLPGREGVGGLLRGFLGQLTTASGAYLPSDGPRLGAVVADLASALLANALEAGDDPAAPARHRTLAVRVRSFIQQHLHDPRLTPGAVATANHISTSYLHRLFQRDGTTVAGWIRERRLESARRDLADPALSTVSIGHIGVRWGFTHPAAFSRAFRTTYGLSPREYRHRALLPGV